MLLCFLLHLPFTVTSLSSYLKSVIGIVIVIIKKLNHSFSFIFNPLGTITFFNCWNSTWLYWLIFRLIFKFLIFIFLRISLDQSIKSRSLLLLMFNFLVLLFYWFEIGVFWTVTFIIVLITKSIVSFKRCSFHLFGYYSVHYWWLFRQVFV